jgi:hypothetical protein
MRDKQLKQVVCNHTTGVAEADMLGNILLFVERTNRPGPHGYHRKRTVRMSTQSKLRVAVKRTWRYLNEKFKSLGQTWTSLRRGKSILGKGKNDTPKYLSGVRKKRVNR